MEIRRIGRRVGFQIVQPSGDFLHQRANYRRAIVPVHARKTTELGEGSMIDVILLDMDGVLADFVSAAIGVCGLPLKHDEVDQWDFFLPYMTAEEFWQKIDAVPGFWSNVIQPYPWAPEIVALCKENAKQVVFASAPAIIRIRQKARFAGCDVISLWNGTATITCSGRTNI